MSGVEHVEKILCEGPFDESSLAVVKVDRDKGESGYPSASKRARPDDSLKDLLVSQHIKQKNEAIPPATVVSPEEYRDHKETQQTAEHILVIVLETLYGT